MDTKPDEVQEVQVPSEHVAVVAMFSDRDEAETAVDALVDRGFTDDQISLVARGGGTDDSGAFVPGGLMVTVSAKERDPEADRALREHTVADVSVMRIGRDDRGAQDC